MQMDFVTNHFRHYISYSCLQSMEVTKQYCVVKFREMLFLDTEEYQLVPATWILSRSKKDAIIAFPLMNRTKLLDAVQKREPPRERWLSFPASIEYESGEHWTLFVNNTF
ncbi:conserved hypothetical protein [Bracoviriform facetosae]|uniref:Uncharacterized protein n=1 Tax=Bracoviriform facetosae TaxID=2083300 RepID=B8PQ80_9VIRU|nr:conserved hypothetical protein [Bracoviriform facetosae]ACE75506.1 conserved hypothetical protein [Bracoviriform facetosae]